MRILHLTNEFNQGGLAYMINSIVKLQVSQDDCIRLMIPKNHTANIDSAAIQVDKVFDGRTVNGIIANGIKGIFVCLKWRPNVVFIHSRGYIPFLGLIKTIFNIRIIFCSHLTNVKDSKLFRVLTQFVDTVVVSSQYDVKIMEEKFPSWKGKTKYIPMPLWTNTVKYGSRPSSDTVTYLLMGRLEPIKGHATAIKALATLPFVWKLEIPGIVNSENSGYVSSLINLADSLGISDRVHFVGHVDFWSVDVDVALLPSLNDSLTLSALIFFIRRIPVVRSKTQGYFVFPEGQYGFEIGNENELSFILKCIHSKEENMTLLNSAELYGKRSLNIEQIKKLYIDLC